MQLPLYWHFSLLQVDKTQSADASWIEGLLLNKFICEIILYKKNFYWYIFSELWKDPSSFQPERFLSSDGTEVNKLEGEKVLAFGLGKRRCIGEVIARNEVFLFLAILIQRLQFRTKPGELLDLTPEYGLTMKHKRCHLQATLRARSEL